jgi:pimeloyl-ACP methyl ester carboxylesterase
MCATYGFQFEEHTVVTEDGYILTVWRIPGLANEPTPTSAKPSVLLQHGILDSANAWVMNYETVSPAFVTARGGYDVWLGNSRGNTYSLGHVNKMKDKEYWAFDWEQMGQYDIPAVIEHIVQVTGNQKVSYVGHSQGTTQMFYGMSEFHDYYKSRVNLAVMLGPVTKIPNAQSDAIHLMADFYDEIVFEADLLNIYAVFQKNFLTSMAMKLFCSPFAWFCEAAEYLLISHNVAADDKDRFEVYMDHEPNGSSLQAMLLYAQNMKRDRF